MDAEGNVIGKPGDRTVAAFSETRDALVRVDAVRAKAEAGDQKAAVELLFLDFSLGNIKAEDLEAGVATLAEFATKEQLTEAKQIGLDGRIYETYVASFQEDGSAAVDTMIGLLEAGQMPTPGSRACSGFWSVIGEHARESGDTKLLRRVVKGMRADMASDTRAMDQAASYEETALGLDKRDALVARQTGGEAKLEAKILLLEASLDAVTLGAFRERLEAAMAVASDAEKAELLQADVDLEVNDLVISYWSDGNRDELHLKLMSLLETHEPAPSEDLAGLLRSPVYYFARSVDDPELLDWHVAAMTKRYGEDSPMRSLVKYLSDAAAKLREEAE